MISSDPFMPLHSSIHVYDLLTFSLPTNVITTKIYPRKKSETVLWKTFLILLVVLYIRNICPKHLTRNVHIENARIVGII